jgi:hypothetical protein
MSVTKVIAFWDIAPCSLLEIDRLFRGAYCICHRSDGSSAHLWNVGLLQRDYTALYPTRLSNSHSLPWEPETSQFPSRLTVRVCRSCHVGNNWNYVLTVVTLVAGNTNEAVVECMVGSRGVWSWPESGIRRSVLCWCVWQKSGKYYNVSIFNLLLIWTWSWTYNNK